MNKIIGNFLKVTLLAAGLTGSVHAAHDNGQGNSQDGKNPLDSVSVAPEPSTFWLFLSGALAIAAYMRRKKSS